MVYWHFCSATYTCSVGEKVGCPRPAPWAFVGLLLCAGYLRNVPYVPWTHTLHTYTAHIQHTCWMLVCKQGTRCYSAQSYTDWATSACLRAAIWNSYTTKLRPIVATVVEHHDYNSNNVTVASAPWTAVHVKQNYNAHRHVYCSLAALLAITQQYLFVK